MAKAKKKAASKAPKKARKKAARRPPKVRVKPPKPSKDASGILSELGSHVVKEYATRQPVRLTMTAAQMKAVREELKGKDPSQPTEVSFYVGGRKVADLRVAGYWYAGSTCCV